MAIALLQTSERTRNLVRGFKSGAESKVTSWRTTAERTVLRALAAGF